MAITLVGSPTHKARTTFEPTTTVVRTGVTAGNLLVVPIAYFQGTGRTITLASSPSNTWTRHVQSNGDANSHIEIWYAANAAAGDTTLTFGWSAGSGNGQLEGDVLEFSSAATGSPADATATNTGTSTGPSVASGALSQADEVLIALASHTGTDTTFAPDGTYTQISENEDNDTGQTYHSQYRIVASASSDTANWTLGASRAWFAVLASFKGAAAGGVTETLDVAGTLSPAGVVGTQGRKTLAGATTPAGTVRKQGATGLAGALSLAGTVAALKTALLALAGAFSPAGVMAFQAGKVGSGALSPAGALGGWQVARQVGGVVTPAGTALKQSALAMAGALSLTGTVATLKAALVAVAGSLGLTGTVTTLKTVFLALAGTLHPVGTLVKQVAHTLAGALTPAGTVQALKVALVALAGTLALAGTVSHQVLLTLRAVLSPLGVVSKRAQRLWAGALGLAGTVATLLNPSAGGYSQLFKPLFRPRRR